MLKKNIYIYISQKHSRPIIPSTQFFSLSVQYPMTIDNYSLVHPEVLKCKMQRPCISLITQLISYQFFNVPLKSYSRNTSKNPIYLTLHTSRFKRYITISIQSIKQRGFILLYLNRKN